MSPGATDGGPARGAGAPEAGGIGGTGAPEAPDSVLRSAAALVCEACGQPFTPKPRSHGTRFCGSPCRMRWHVERRERLLRELATALSTAAALVKELRGTEADG